MCLVLALIATAAAMEIVARRRRERALARLVRVLSRVAGGDEAHRANARTGPHDFRRLAWAINRCIDALVGASQARQRTDRATIRAAIGAVDDLTPPSASPNSSGPAEAPAAKVLAEARSRRDRRLRGLYEAARGVAEAGACLGVQADRFAGLVENHGTVVNGLSAGASQATAALERVRARLEGSALADCVEGQRRWSGQIRETLDGLRHEASQMTDASARVAGALQDASILTRTADVLESMAHGDGVDPTHVGATVGQVRALQEGLRLAMSRLRSDLERQSAGLGSMALQRPAATTDIDAAVLSPLSQLGDTLVGALEICAATMKSSEKTSEKMQVLAAEARASVEAMTVYGERLVAAFAETGMDGPVEDVVRQHLARRRAGALSGEASLSPSATVALRKVEADGQAARRRLSALLHETETVLGVLRSV